MDPLSIAPLALSAWNFILPYANKLAGKLVEKAGESVPDVVGKVWDAVKEKMEARPETQSLPADLVTAPEDEEIQGAFKYQLKKLLENDEAFARQLEESVKEAKQAISYSADMNGDGAIAQGNKSVAVGRGGIHIGGQASGNTIIAGNNNVVNDKKNRKRKK